MPLDDAHEWLDSTTTTTPIARPAPPRTGEGEAQPVPPIYVCPEPDCATCRIAVAGAKALCREVGFDYDTLTEESQDYYKHYAREVMAAMSDAMLDSGMVVETQAAD